MNGSPPSGWYPDPQGPPGQERWWDSSNGVWGEHVRQAGPAPPVAEPTRQRTRWWAWAVLAGVVLVVIIGAASSSGGSSGSSTPADTRPAQFQESSAPPTDQHPLPARTGLPSDAPEGAVPGVLDRECDELFHCSSPDAARRLAVSGVYCYWRGRFVLLHVSLRNPMNAGVSVSITPKYFIEDGGQHGTSYGSDRTTSIPAHGSREFVVNAGHPEAVANGTPIAKCAPHFSEVDIGS